jgi:aspartate oxidase
LGAASDNIIETDGALILGGDAAVLFTALKREESRGAHFRADHPQMENIPERTFLTLTLVLPILR